MGALVWVTSVVGSKRKRLGDIEIQKWRQRERRKIKYTHNTYRQ